MQRDREVFASTKGYARFMKTFTGMHWVTVGALVFVDGFTSSACIVSSRGTVKEPVN